MRSRKFAIKFCVLRILFALLISLTSAWSEVREFRNIKGAVLKAEFLGQQGNNVKVRRASDGKVFTLPLASLSAADQAWLKTAKPAPRSIRSGAPWQRLVIEHPWVPATSEVPELIGLGRTEASFQNGATTSELLLPIGAWVNVNTRPIGANGESHDTLVRFNGASHWKISGDGSFLLVSRDGSLAEIVSIKLPDREHETLDTEMAANTHPFGSTVCFQYSSQTDLTKLPSVNGSPIAFSITGTLDDAQLQQFANLKPLAIKLRVSPPLFRH